MHCTIQPFAEYAVALRVGAWIETYFEDKKDGHIESHSVWVRGLKLFHAIKIVLEPIVALRVGAWIETIIGIKEKLPHIVALRVGAWIETEYLQCQQGC